MKKWKRALTNRMFMKFPTLKTVELTGLVELFTGDQEQRVQ